MLVGTAQDDVIQGLGGNDTLSGLAGSDTLIGGTGLDKASYQGDPGVINVTFTGTTSGTVIDGYGGGGTDTFSEVEFVLGSQFGDTFTGAGGSTNRFIGLQGSDTFLGNGGDEGFHDVVDYSFDVLFGATHGVRVNQSGTDIQGDLAPDTATDSFGYTDSLPGVRDVIGTQFADEIYGGGHGNTITAGAGSDLVLGFDGNDIIDGGAGNDNLDGGADNDTMIGGAGNDTMIGGAGNDRAVYQTDPSGINVTFTGATSGTVIDGYGGTDTFSDVEFILGSGFGDTFTGADGSTNRFIGLQGNDTFLGNGGDEGFHDVVDYSFEALLPGAGTDGVVVNQSAEISQGGLAPDTATDSFGNTDSLPGVRDVIGTKDDDELYGGGHNN